MAVSCYGAWPVGSAQTALAGGCWRGVSFVCVCELWVCCMVEEGKELSGKLTTVLQCYGLRAEVPAALIDSVLPFEYQTHIFTLRAEL